MQIHARWKEQWSSFLTYWYTYIKKKHLQNNLPLPSSTPGPLPPPQLKLAVPPPPPWPPSPSTKPVNAQANNMQPQSPEPESPSTSSLHEPVKSPSTYNRHQLHLNNNLPKP